MKRSKKSCPTQITRGNTIRVEWLLPLDPYAWGISLFENLQGIIAYFFLGFLMAAWAAASLAIGTRKGEQET